MAMVPQIHRLGLRKCNLLTPCALDAPSTLRPNLRSFDVSQLLALGNCAICALAHSTHASLHFLALHGCTSKTRRGLRAPAGHHTALRFLDVEAVPAVDDDALDLKARNPLGATLRNLILPECVTVGEECTSLMSLTMHGLLQLTDAGLANLYRSLGSASRFLTIRLMLGG